MCRETHIYGGTVFRDEVPSKQKPLAGFHGGREDSIGPDIHAPHKIPLLRTWCVVHGPESVSRLT